MSRLRTPWNTLPSLTREYRLIAHVVLEHLIRHGVPTDPIGLFRLSNYLDVAWAMADSTLKSPPKKLVAAKLLVDEWKRTGSIALDDSGLNLLCSAVECADTLWSRIPLPELLKVLYAMKDELICNT